MRRQVGPRTACNSTLYGDVRFRSCGPFCKEAKRSNHCHFCKCADCSFCTSPALDAHASVASPFSPTPTISAAELDRLSRRDDAITAAMYGYGVVALLSLVAWCLNQMIRDGAGCGGGKKSTEQRP